MIAHLLKLLAGKLFRTDCQSNVKTTSLPTSFHLIINHILFEFLACYLTLVDHIEADEESHDGAYHSRDAHNEDALQ